MTANRHLVAVWNPSYAVDAMDAHLRVLRAWSQRHDDGKATDEQLYVWWGKVKSPNRQQPAAHLEDARAAALAAREGGEVQLYLTDYRALYVGEVLDVAAGDLPTAEQSHVPPYYMEGQLRCDLWFKLGDIRRLVADDTLQVVEELKKLRNVHYNDRPVSIYGGMVDLPLVVTREDDRRFFDPDERDQLTDGVLWAEFDAEAGSGTAAMERELRENRFGESLWSALEPATRTFVATGERLFREHRLDPAFDFASVLMNFAKAVEVQANAVLRRALGKLPGAARMVNVEGSTIDLAEYRALGLGELARAIGGERELNVGLANALENGRWFTQQMPPVLDELRQVRNPGAHAAVVDRTTAKRWRDQVVGIGCAGLLVELARTTVKR
jgi:hypothetical protein